MNKHKEIFCLIIFICCMVGLFIFFKDSLWLIINIIVSLFISFCFSMSILFFFSPEEDKNVSNGIGLLIVSIACFAFMTSAFYKSPQEIKKEEDIKRLEEQIEEQERISDQKLTEEFLKSDKNFIFLGKADNQTYFVIRAKSAIKNIAHDPESVTDVTAIAPPLKFRIKMYPTCKYIIQVQYRAKNRFGAYVREEAFVLFDGNKSPIQVLSKSPF